MDTKMSQVKYVSLPSSSPVVELKCDVCTVSLFLQACQCKSGHNFCGYCYERMHICPICQIPKIEPGSFTWRLVNDIKNDIGPLNPSPLYFDTSIPPPPMHAVIPIPVPVQPNHTHLILNQNQPQPPMDYRQFLNDTFFLEERNSFVQNLRPTSS